MSKDLRNVASVSAITIISRVTGLFRDVVFFAVLGANSWSSAFVLGFTIPNLFRRLFGEGALSSAFIPVFSSIVESRNLKNAFSFFNIFIIRWVFYLSVIACILVLLLQVGITLGLFPERWLLSIRIFQSLMPYMVFICLAAIITGALNVLGRFFSPSLAPVVFNLVLILVLSLGALLNLGSQELVVWLCIGVLLGGILQLGLPAFDLIRQGWKFDKIRETESDKDYFKGFWVLFLPSLLGAALLQINILISRLFAHSLDDVSVSFIYISSRLMELPLGVFTIAIVTVFFPKMSRLYLQESKHAFSQIVEKGMRFILIIVTPATLGLCLLSREILSMLFQWGRFSVDDVIATAPIVVIYALALPFHSIATFLVRAFYAKKDMKVPLRLSLYFLVLNIVFSIILMNIWGVYGLATANLITAIIHAYFLVLASHKSFSISFLRVMGRVLKPITIGSLSIALICLLGKFLISIFEYNEKTEVFLVLLLLIPLSVLSYFFILSLFGISFGRIIRALKNSA